MGRKEKEQLDLLGTDREYRRRLTAEQIASIRDVFHRGTPCSVIAQRIGVSTTMARRCIVGETFKHHGGAKVQGSEFHRMNRRNLDAYAAARKYAGGVPTEDQVYEVFREQTKVRADEVVKELELGKDKLCHYCNGAPGTVPVKLVVEGRVLNDRDMCARCYGEFYVAIAGFFG